MLNKEDVLNRPEIDMSDIDYKHFKIETSVGDQFWHGDKCYIGVQYKAQQFKMRYRPRCRLIDYE